jgi:hypothetical protein
LKSLESILAAVFQRDAIWHEICCYAINEHGIGAGENSPVLLRGIKRRIIMNLTKKIENLFVAITFAEAGEFETAREYLRDEERPRQFDRVVPTLRPRKELKAPGLRK